MAFRTWTIRGLLLALLGGLGYGVWRVQSYVSPDAVRAAVAASFGDQFPRTEVRVGSARMRVFGGISVRDLALARAGDGEPFFVAPAAVIYHDKEQVNRGRLVIRKIELDGPTLRLERTADGWTLDGLTKPGPADATLPTFVVTRATVTVTDRRPNGLPPLTLADASFTLVNDPAPVFLNLTARATATVGGRVTAAFNLAARLNRRTGQATVRAELPDLPLGPDLADLLAPYLPDPAPLWAVTGRLGLAAEVSREPDAAPRYDLRVTLRDGRIAHDALPAPIEGITVAARLADGRLTVEKATARLGASAVEASLATGNLLTGRSDSPEDLLDRAEVTVRDLPLDDALFDRLARFGDKAAKRRRLFNPAGTAHVGYRFQRRPGGWLRTVEFRPARLALMYDKFRYPVTDLAGAVVARFTHDDQDEITVDLSGSAGGQRVALAGTVAGPDPDPFIALKLSGTNVPIDDRLFDALPGPKYPAALRKFRASGRGDFEADIRQAKGVNKTESVFRVRVYDAAVCHTQFPYPLEGVAGNVTVYVTAVAPGRPVRPGEPVEEPPDTDRVEIRDCTARHGPGTVWLRGDSEPVPGTRDRRLSLSVWGKDCPVDDHLRRAVARLDLESAWRTFAPRGAMTFNIDLGILDRAAPATPARPPVGPVVPPRSPAVPSLGQLMKRASPAAPADVPFDPATDLTLAVNFEGPSVTPDFFPYDLDALAGQVRYEGSRVRVERMTARHGRSRWRLDAGEVRFFPSGQVFANLGRLDVAPLVADPAFVTALPPLLAKGVRELNLRGPAELTMSHVVVLTPPDAPAVLPELVARGQDSGEPRPQGSGPPGPADRSLAVAARQPDPDVFWRGELRLAGAGFDAGVACENVTGRLACAGRHHGTHLGRVVGTLWLDRAAVAGHPVSAAKLAFDADPQTPNPAKPGELLPPAFRVPDLTATLFRGTVAGTGRVVLSDQPRYTLDVHATGVRLEDLARHHGIGTPATLEGEAQAHLYLSAGGAAPAEGGGTVDVDRGRLGNLPKLVPLLKVLKLQAPDKTVFEAAHATFTVRGDRVRVDHLDLLGTAVSFGGAGELDTSGERVRLDVYPIWSQTLHRWLTTPLGDVSAAVSGGLFRVEVSRGPDGQWKYEPRVVPAVTDPMRAVAERIKARAKGGPVYRAAPNK
jgi:hypothetical protein